jgi:hypothetical protein
MENNIPTAEAALKTAWGAEFNSFEEFMNCYPLDKIK